MSDTNNTTKVTFKPLKNILNYYDQPSYHMTLSITDDTTGTNKKIICETGEAPLSIQNLTIEAQVGASVEAKNTTVTNLTMTISEPMGANILDTMYDAAKSLNIKNFNDVPYVLEIYFHGYDPTSGSMISKIDNTTFKYYLKLQDLQTNFNSGNVIHTLNMIPFDETAFYDCYTVLTDGFNIPVTDSETLGSFLDKLKTKLNQNWLDNYGVQTVEYDFEYENYDSSMDLPTGITSPKDLKIKLNKSNTSTSGRGDYVHFSDLTSILSIIDNLFSCSDDAILLIAPNAGGVKNSSLPTQVSKIQSIAHHIKTTVTNGDYNSSLNNYNKKITFTICPYLSYRLFDCNEAIQSMYDTSLNTKRANMMVQKNLLRKNYDYIFTGKNTEVLNIDLSFNFNWSYVVDINRGITDSYSQIVGKEYSSDTVDTSLLSTDNLTTSNTSSSIMSTSNILNGSSSDLINLSQDNTMLDALTNVVASDTLTNLQNDTTNCSGYIPITIQSYSRKNNYKTQFGFQGDNTGGRSLYGFLLNQLQTSPTQEKLQNLSMSIKGDPYWLGTNNDVTNSSIIQSNTISNISSSITTNNISSVLATSSATPSTTADYTLGEQNFTLNFVLPTGYNSSTYNVNLNQANVYSGIYSVIKVTSNFSNGVFTQTIDAIKVNGMINSQILNITRDDT